jgi:hypothetical protein
MRRGNAAAGRALVAPLVVVSLLLAPTSTAPAHGHSAGYDEDPFHISGAEAVASGSVEWSHGSDPGTVRGWVQGRLTFNGHSGCAHVDAVWMDGDAGTMRSGGQTACAGGSTDLSLSYSSPGLQCVRLRLVVRGEEVGDSRLLCAGGS